MNYLLDTNAWILLADAPDQVPETVRDMAGDMANAPLGLSAISPWEVAKKTALDKLQLSLPIRQWMQQASQPEGVEILPLTWEVALESAYLPGTFHRDPADQIIVATARVHNLTLLTSDRKILDYPHVKTRWE
jgi:PIN domain nuclease of toxin-antitoxin system